MITVVSRGTKPPGLKIGVLSHVVLKFVVLGFPHLQLALNFARVREKSLEALDLQKESVVFFDDNLDSVFDDRVSLVFLSRFASSV